MTEIPREFINNIILGDCVKVMKKIPSESIDLVFIDPPYNLGKKYNVYMDKRGEKEYIEWSLKWINESIRVLKPTGSLFIVNIPKWILYYMEYLNKKLYLQNVIAWFGLSEPLGKIMPANYPIIWYTKHPTDFKLNRENLKKLRLYPRHVCLRHKWYNNKTNDIINQLSEELTDVWYDIHRIRHRTKRIDVHPCQLPEKLLERIILLTTDENDIVLDPMAGTGTTLVVAKKLKRRYIGIEIDPLYVDIIKKQLKTPSIEEFLGHK